MGATGESPAGERHDRARRSRRRRDRRRAAAPAPRGRDGSTCDAETGWHVVQAVELIGVRGVGEGGLPPRRWQVEIQAASVRAQPMSWPGE